jgi:hypothetical protein
VLSAGWLVVAVVLAILLSMWVTFTLTRLDRLHARVDATWAALDAQLVRRAAALQHVAESAESGISAEQRGPCDEVARAALAAQGGQGGSGLDGRRAAENAVGRMIAALATSGRPLPPDARAELREGSARVQVARRFYNDAVRDTRSLRARRMPRLLHLAGHRDMPQFFDIDDTLAFPPMPIKEGS